MKRQIIAAADEVVDRVELAKFLSVNGDPEDEDFEKTKKKMETTRVEALYQKGLALVEVASLKGEMAANLDAQVVDKPNGQSSTSSVDLFEETFKELQKWADSKSSKFSTLVMIRERHSGRLGTALKVVNGMIEEDGKKKLYEERISLLEQSGWEHLVVYEKQWMFVRFPPALPLF